MNFLNHPSIYQSNSHLKRGRSHAHINYEISKANLGSGNQYFKKKTLKELKSKMKIRSNTNHLHLQTYKDHAHPSSPFQFIEGTNFKTNTKYLLKIVYLNPSESNYLGMKEMIDLEINLALNLRTSELFLHLVELIVEGKTVYLVYEYAERFSMVSVSDQPDYKKLEVQLAIALGQVNSLSCSLGYIGENQIYYDKISKNFKIGNLEYCFKHEDVIPEEIWNSMKNCQSVAGFTCPDFLATQSTSANTDSYTYGCLFLTILTLSTKIKSDFRPEILTRNPKFVQKIFGSSELSTDQKRLIRGLLDTVDSGKRLKTIDILLQDYFMLTLHANPRYETQMEFKDRRIVKSSRAIRPPTRTHQDSDSVHLRENDNSRLRRGSISPHRSRQQNLIQSNKRRKSHLGNLRRRKSKGLNMSALYQLNKQFEKKNSRAGKTKAAPKQHSSRINNKLSVLHHSKTEEYSPISSRSNKLLKSPNNKKLSPFFNNKSSRSIHRGKKRKSRGRRRASGFEASSTKSHLEPANSKNGEIENQRLKVEGLDKCLKIQDQKRRESYRRRRKKSSQAKPDPVKGFWSRLVEFLGCSEERIEG